MRLLTGPAGSGKTSLVLDEARAWLRDRHANMAESTYQEGMQFLNRIEDALRRMDS